MSEPGAEREAERRVAEIANWDGAPYTVALEIKKMLDTIKDTGTNIDSGTGLFWPRHAAVPIAGHAEADLHVTIGGTEFYIAVRKSNNQLLSEGITAKQLGLDGD